MALTSVHDVLEVEKRIAAINNEREELAAQLEKARKESTGGNGNGSTKSNSLAEYVEDMASEIIHSGKSLEGVRALRARYGSLQILDSLENGLLQREAEENALVDLRQLHAELNGLSEETAIHELENFGQRLASIRHAFGAIPTRLEAAVDSVYTQFRELLSLRARDMSGEFKRRLLESKWDASAIVSTEMISDLKLGSTDLYRLSQLVKEQNCDEVVLWNMQCIANNFKIRFTYHFHDDSLKIETYFKYLNDYLTRNLYKCISIFHDEENGVTKQMLHEQFINHVLQPIREKVESGLSQKDVKMLISLISQILTTDRNLAMSFHYHGMGMISLVPVEIWDIWLSYEVETATKQFDKLTANSKDMIESPSDFIILLSKVYSYFKPFYGLEYEPLEKYKLLSFSQIFINLSSQYLDRILTADSLDDLHTDEDELYQTLMKLQNVNAVHEKTIELSEEYIFIHLTDVVNERESKNYSSLFQNVFEEYRKVIEESIQPTVIHRIKKLLKDSLRNYFKINGWSTNTDQEPETTNSELVSAIKLMSRITIKLDSLNIPLGVSLCIKNELLNIIVNYFIESILKLNRFSKQGLQQYSLDFQTMRDSLSLPDDNANTQESILLELVKILFLKYDKNGEQFYDTAYIKESNYCDLRAYLSIDYLIDSEIQDALYRIAYGSIL